MGVISLWKRENSCGEFEAGKPLAIYLAFSSVHLWKRSWEVGGVWSYWDEPGCFWSWGKAGGLWCQGGLCVAFVHFIPLWINQSQCSKYYGGNGLMVFFIGNVFYFCFLGKVLLYSPSWRETYQDDFELWSPCLLSAGVPGMHLHTWLTLVTVWKKNYHLNDYTVHSNNLLTYLIYKSTNKINKSHLKFGEFVFFGSVHHRLEREESPLRWFLEL